MNSNRLSISQRHEDGWLVLSLAGNVDASTFQDFEELLTRAAQGRLWLRLEMQGLRSINSTGLGLLMATHRHLREKGGRLEIRGLSPQMTNIFNLLGLSRLLDEDDPDEGAAGVVAR